MHEKEVYVWRGLIRKYRLTAFYEGGDEPRMVRLQHRVRHLEALAPKEGALLDPFP